MPPLPTGDMPVAHESSPEAVAHVTSEIDLSKLRQGWNKQFATISTLPVDKGTSAEKPASATIEDLPELPSLGAIASQAAMSMDDLDDFLTRYHDPSSPVVESHTPVKKNTPFVSSEAVPEMPTTAQRPTVSTPPQRGDLNDLPAFPTPSIPKVSMPLVRDTLEEKSDDITPPPTPAQPDLSDLRKTAPQFSKFSPAPEDESENIEVEEVAPERDEAEGTANFTDEDLRDALQPIIDPVVDQFLYKPSQGIHTFLEPMLRSTVRRAIAEQMHDASPFEVAGWDKFAWKLRAMFGSRSYDDIVFDYTRRYQVEEVYLLRPHSRSLISYASQDPVRHAKPEKVQDTVKKIASKESEHKDVETPWIKWKDNRNLMIRRGEHCMLAAIVHGPSNAILRADLDYALRQAEERYGKALEEESDIHIQILQPLLEGCLLIQAPAIPN